MLVAVIDYGSGNLQSVRQALIAAAALAGINADIQVCDDPATVGNADRLVLPGVGAFGDCKSGLEGINGMADALMEATGTKGLPFLGICVGMQLMATAGREGGRVDGFGWIEGEVTALAPSDQSLKIPHMGWNSLSLAAEHPVWEGVDEGAAVYFLHSFAFTGGNGSADSILARTDYGGPVVAAVGRDNLVGLQFHPEKSQSVGQRILANWLKWKP